MTDPAVTDLRQRIAALIDERTSITARRGQIDKEIVDIQAAAEARITALRTERLEGMVASERTMIQERAYQRALSVLEESIAEPTPDPVIEIPDSPPATPNPTPTPAPQRAKVKRQSKDPMRVLPRRHPEGVESPRVAPTVPATEATANDLTPRLKTNTTRERADLVWLMLAVEGAMAQYQVADMLQKELDDCNAKTAQKIASDCLKLLNAENRIRWTGNKVARPGKRNASSPVFKIVETGSERASAGLPVTDDDFRGTTTHPANKTPAYDGPGKIAIDSSAFEQGKGR